MFITGKQRSWAIRIIDNLYKWNLTLSFRGKLDPNVEGYTDYYDKIKNPMFLDQVKTKLWDGEYKTIDSFISDLKLPFENAKLYHGPGTVYYIIAEEILLWIKEQEKYANLSEDEVWFNELVHLQDRMENLIKIKPQQFAQSLLPQR